VVSERGGKVVESYKYINKREENPFGGMEIRRFGG
jgi:hypothetical protein